MEVILLSDIPKVGKKYAVVHVAPGFARNFIIAKGLGEAVTKQNAKKVADLSKKRAAEEAHRAELLGKAVAGMKGVTLSFIRKANEEGHLYASVSAADIAEELAKVASVDVPTQNLHSDHPIKALGEHSVTVKIGDQEAHIKVIVTQEEE